MNATRPPAHFIVALCLGGLLMMPHEAASDSAENAPGAALGGSEAVASSDAPISDGAPAVAWEASELGETAFVPMDSAPYPHESRVDGHEYNGKAYPAAEHYSDSTVGLFVPAGYRRGDTVDLLVYWHGWFNNVRKSIDEFHLREQIVGAGKNVILVFPEGPKDAPDSQCGRLEEEGALAALIADALATLKAEGKIDADAQLGRVILSGHSGAYRVISACVMHGGLEENVAEVFLLDASYALLDRFADWATRRPDARLMSIFTEHLRGENEELMKMLDERGVEYSLLQEHDHPDADLTAERVVFISTTQLDHNGAVQLLEPWLRTSRLDPIKTDTANSDATATSQDSE